jgi:hypothetical protein
MNKKDPILAIINEAKTYILQGLFNEARSKFKEARKLIINDVRIRNKNSLAARIDQEIADLEDKDSYQGDTIAFDQLPYDIQARIQQINESVENTQERKKRFATGNMPTVSIVKRDRKTIPTDIITIEVTVETSSADSAVYELDVTFQEGSRLSVIIPKANKVLAETIGVGVQIDDIRYLTLNAIVEGAGVVVSCSEIAKGPKNGDYSLTLQIL